MSAVLSFTLGVLVVFVFIESVLAVLTYAGTCG